MFLTLFFFPGCQRFIFRGMRRRSGRRRGPTPPSPGGGAGGVHPFLLLLLLIPLNRVPPPPPAPKNPLCLPSPQRLPRGSPMFCFCIPFRRILLPVFESFREFGTRFLRSSAPVGCNASSLLFVVFVASLVRSINSSYATQHKRKPTAPTALTPLLLLPRFPPRCPYPRVLHAVFLLDSDVPITCTNPLASTSKRKRRNLSLQNVPFTELSSISFTICAQNISIAN